jgi:hypothetical protein
MSKAKSLFFSMLVFEEFGGRNLEMLMLKAMLHRIAMIGIHKFKMTLYRYMQCKIILKGQTSIIQLFPHMSSLQKHEYYNN